MQAIPIESDIETFIRLRNNVSETFHLEPLSGVTQITTSTIMDAHSNESQRYHNHKSFAFKTIDKFEDLKQAKVSILSSLGQC